MRKSSKVFVGMDAHKALQRIDVSGSQKLQRRRIPVFGALQVVSCMATVAPVQVASCSTLPSV